MHVDDQRPAATTRAGAPEEFRQWWNSYRRDLVMSGTQQSFVARWWAELSPTLRAYLAHAAGLDAPDKAVAKSWDSLPLDDRSRLLVTARTVFLELKPSSWL